MTLVAPDLDEIRACLDEVKDPCSLGAGTPLGLGEMGMIERVLIDDDQIVVGLRLTAPSCYMHGWFIEEINREVGSVAPGWKVQVEFDAGMNWSPDLMSDEVKARRAEVNRRRAIELRERRQVAR
jgi:metal-sulfur cluster biosynthetic enzyme